MLHNGAPWDKKGASCSWYSPAISSAFLFSFFLISSLSLSFFFISGHPVHSFAVFLILHCHPLSPMSVFLALTLPPPLLSLCISCIVNSSQKHDKVSAHVPPASLSVLPAICYCLLAIVCVCLYHAFFILFFLCVRKAKVN